MSSLMDILTKMHKELESNDYMTDDERADIRKIIYELVSFSGWSFFVNKARMTNLSARAAAIWENAQSRGKKAPKK